MEPYEHKIQYYETDRMGVTHHSNYIRIMEEARVWYLEQLGWGYDRLEALGVVSPVVEVQCSYKKACTFADVVRVELAVAELTGVRLRLRYTMTVRGETVCTAESTHCFLDAAGRPVAMRRKFPEFHAALTRWKAETQPPEDAAQ